MAANKQSNGKYPLKPGPGRPKGSQNRVTVEAKAAIEATFHDLGGSDALTTWATENPDDFYKHVWVKILPKNMDITSGGKALTDTERSERLAALLAAIAQRG